MIQKEELTKMITAIENIQEKIQDVFQEVLLQYYLQPMNGVEKKELRDGYIERTIHGAMHATRAALYVDILHQLRKKYYPSETQKTLLIFKERFGIDETHLMTLTELAVLFHDSARKGEGQDIWEAESAQNLVYFLEEKSIDSKLIHLFQYALIDKDNPTAFITRFNQEDTSSECIDAYNYIRQLIQGADCLEIIRCVGKFQFTYLHFYENSQSKAYKESLKTLVFNIHELLYIQGDLLYDCKLFSEEGQIQTLYQGSKHVLATKVIFEHSSNIYQSILGSLNNLSYFNTGRNTQLVKCRLEHPELVFNPHIHGTNSSIFILLPKTEYRFLSPIEMMELYQTAPVSGEIRCGGLSEVKSSGRMCFGRIDTHKDEYYKYGKNKIITSYTKIEFTEPSIDIIKGRLASCIRKNFDDINMFMIDLTRAKLCGIDLATEIPEIKKHITNTLQYYDLIVFILTHLSFNLDEFAKQDAMPWDTCVWPTLDSFPTYYEFNAIRNRIAEKGLDLTNIIQNPNKANIECLADVLSLPYVLKDKDLTMPTAVKVFTPSPNNSVLSNKEEMSFVVKEFELLRDEGISGLLKKIGLQGSANYKENVFPAIKEHVLTHIECLKRRL